MINTGFLDAEDRARKYPRTFPRQTNEEILQWLKPEKIAEHQGPRNSLSAFVAWEGVQFWLRITAGNGILYSGMVIKTDTPRKLPLGTLASVELRHIIQMAIIYHD